MFNSNLATLCVLLIIGYAILYFGGRKYLENFDTRINTDGSPNMNPESKLETHPPESNSNRIDLEKHADSDKYEISAIFQNQGSKEASKKQINDAMTRYPMDWSVQGPNSQYYQDNQAKYEKNNPIKQLTEEDLLLPDMKSMEEEELKILQTYQPESSKGLLEYSVEDVKTLLEKVYLKRGLIPVIEKSKQGQNVWEIVELKEKDPLIVWEDDQTDRQKMTQRGEDNIDIPYEASDMAAGLDPFLKPRNAIDGKNNYNKFTPELEDIFTPTSFKPWA